MALAITKNDISGVYGTPAPLKITKSDISSVYAKREKPKQPVILNEAKRSELAVCRGRQLVCRPRADARYGGARASQRLQPEESHSHKGGALRSDRQDMRYFAPLRSTQYDTPGQSSVILKLPKAARESHSHKGATLSNTSPFTITKSDISTVYSAPKTADAKTDRIHKMYSDYAKKQEEEIKSNQLIPKIKDTAKGLSNIEIIKNYFPEKLLLNRRTKKRESMIMMEGFRNDDKPMGFSMCTRHMI